MKEITKVGPVTVNCLLCKEPQNSSSSMSLQPVRDLLVTCAANLKALLLPLHTSPSADVTWLKEAFGLLKIRRPWRQLCDPYSHIVMKSHDRMADLVQEEDSTS